MITSENFVTSTFDLMDESQSSSDKKNEIFNEIYIENQNLKSSIKQPNIQRNKSPGSKKRT